MHQPHIKFWTRLSLLVCALLLALPAALAQTFRGGVNGTVVDNTGAVVSGAAVTLINVDTAARKATVSSSAGEFLFQDLPLGTYSVTVAAQGFATGKYDRIAVSAGQIYTLPVKLAISSSSETVEVNAAAIALDTTTVTQTTVLSAEEVANMPLNGRDFTQMIGLTPGYAGYSVGGYGSLNGTRANQMNWQIDGVDNNDLWHNIPAVNQAGVSGIAGIILPIDAVDQFSAQTQAGPEGGRNPGGTINLTLKAGTNSLHGSVYYFNRNEAYGAKSPFANTKQKVRNYNTGFSVGGPFLKDKLFGFLTFEHQRFVIGQSGNATEPSVGYQTQALALLSQHGVAPSPVMQSVLNTLWAHGNLGADTVGTTNNYHSSDPEYGYSWNGLAKVDYRLTDKDSISVHWFVGQGNQVAPLTHYNLLPYYEIAPIHVQNIAIVYNRVLSSHITNQVLAGVNYFNQIFNDNSTNFNVQGLGFITGANLTNSPNIQIGNFDRVGPTPPEGRNDITGHLTDQLSWVKGAHQMRFGGEFRQAQLDEFYHRHATGAFTFDGTRIARQINAANPSANFTPDGYVAPLADFLAGYTSSASIQVGDPERQVFVNTFFLNAGDTWQVNSKLNINYGVRYDYTGPLHNSNKDLSVFRPGLASSVNGLAVQGVQIQNLFQQYRDSFSPRLGISFQMTPTTVLHAGYGWYFDSPNLNPFLDNRPGNSAPNGVEGNPIGPSPVSGISAPGVVENGVQLNSGKTNIIAGQNIYGSTNTVCNGLTGTVQCGLFSVDANFRPSYNQNYSFNVEQQFSPNVIFQIGYVGSQGRHLLSLLDINQATSQATRPYAQAPYKFINYTNINQIEPIGTSNYNSLQSTLRVQNTHGVSGQFIYTWSHNLDEVTGYRGVLPQNSYDFKDDYSNSDFDTRNNFTTLLSYSLPGTGSGHLRQLTNGWITNALLTFHGGQPFTVFADGDVSGTGEGFDRAVQISDPQKGYQGQHPNSHWLNPAAFTNAPSGSFGTSRRNGYYGPGYSDVDFSVFKDTHFGERVNLQLRAEMFNLLNRVNYAPPGEGFVSVNGDFTLGDTIGDYNGAPGIGAGEAFNMQLGAKITF